jgi:single-strand DNA-binding protein
MALPRVTVVGRMAAEPELRFLPSGAAVCNLRVATSSRKMNRDTNQWEDDKQCFMSVTCWREMAENVADSLHTGDPVIVVGDLSESSFERDGQRQTRMQLDAIAVGPDLKWASARVQRTQRTQGQQQGGSDPWATTPANAPQRPAQAPQQGQQQPAQQAPQQGWGQPGGGWQTPPNYDEPPFVAPPTEFTAGS